jgi:hypothetical protein
MRIMDDQTREALEGSIRKWAAIVDGTGVDTGTSNCQLCQVFYDSGACTGCPVRDKTGEDDCSGSPYEAWKRSHRRGLRLGNGFAANTNARRKMAQAELDFLKSLREVKDE